MPINADSVTVELIAKTDGYTAKVNDAARQTEAAMGRVSGSVGKAENVINLSAARIANGQRNLGRQFADVGASLSSGSSPFVVLAQQLPQIADAITDTGGKAARFASILTGPVGAAGLAVASILATTLLPKLLETGDGVEDLVKKLEEKSARTQQSAEADRIFAGTQAGLAAKVRDTTKALVDQNATLRTNAQLRNVQAQSQNLAARADLDRANAAVKAARSRVQQTFAQGGQRGEVASQRAIEAARAANRELAQAQETARQANVNLNVSRVYLAAESALANSTTQGKIARRYDDRINALQRVAIVEARAGKQIGTATRDRIEALQREKAAALETASAREKVTGGSGRTRSSGASRVRSRAMSTASDISFNFDARYINSDKEFNKLVIDADDAARKADAAFRDVFGREGKDYEGPFGGVDEYNRQQEANARVREDARRKDENQIRDLADFYENAFSGGADGIWRQFKREGLQAIALVLAKLTLGKSLTEALGGLGSGGTGNSGGIIGTIAGLFSSGAPGRASGGNVMAGKIYKINESGPELFQPAQSGKIYPTGSLAAKATGGKSTTIVQQSFTLDARGGITTPELLQYVNNTAKREAATAGKVAYQSSPSRVQAYQTLGT
jgi:hypothetical protein